MLRKFSSLLELSAFGIRISFGFRISDFGFGCDPAALRIMPAGNLRGLNLTKNWRKGWDSNPR
jgi:hypothetical protein